MQHQNKGAEKMFDVFFNILINNVNFFKVPQKVKRFNTLKSNKYNQSWFNSDLNKMKQKLLFLHLLVKKNKNSSWYIDLKNNYDNLKIHYKHSIKEAKMSHNVNYIEGSKNKCKAAWQVIKTNCIAKRPEKTEIDPDSFNIFCKESVLNLKQKIYKSNNTTLDSKEFLKDCVSSPVKFSLMPVTSNDLIRIVKKMNRSNSLDVYSMSNNLIKSLIMSLADPLCLCINQLLKEGIFPNQLKMARVCPIYKKGPTEHPSSYRPISIIPVLSKVIETAVKEQISLYFEENSLFSPSQFGFREGKSTTDALDELLRQAHLALENRDFL